MKLYSDALVEETSRILNLGPVVPVILIKERDHAIPLAEALYEGGVRVFEITLRTPVALDAISDIRQALPDDAVVGAGTVTSAEQVQSVLEFDGQFIITPGMTPLLLDALIDSALPILPGVSSVADIMLGMERGLSQFKLFPAQAVGGVALLRSIYGPFGRVRFCPTGGISLDNMAQFLSLPNVDAVGGSWMSPTDMIAQERWPELTALARDTLTLARRI